MNLVLVNDDSTLGAALLASKFHDTELNLNQFFDQKSLSKQFDHFYLKEIFDTEKESLNIDSSSNQARNEA